MSMELEILKLALQAHFTACSKGRGLTATGMAWVLDAIDTAYYEINVEADQTPAIFGCPQPTLSMPRPHAPRYALAVLAAADSQSASGR